MVLLPKLLSEKVLRDLRCAGETGRLVEFFNYTFGELTAFTALTRNTSLCFNIIEIRISVSANIADFMVSYLLANTDVHKILFLRSYPK